MIGSSSCGGTGVRLSQTSKAVVVAWFRQIRRTRRRSESIRAYGHQVEGVVKKQNVCWSEDGSSDTGGSGGHDFIASLSSSSRCGRAWPAVSSTLCSS